MPSRYENDYSGVGEMLRSSFLRAAMRTRAEAIKAAAEAIAPVGDAESGWYTEGRTPGEYKSSFKVTSGIKTDGATRRCYGRVRNTSGHALAVEYGFKNTPRYRTLGKSLHAAGGDAHFTP